MSYSSKTRLVIEILNLCEGAYIQFWPTWVCYRIVSGLVAHGIRNSVKKGLFKDSMWVLSSFKVVSWWYLQNVMKIWGRKLFMLFYAGWKFHRREKTRWFWWQWISAPEPWDLSRASCLPWFTPAVSNPFLFRTSVTFRPRLVSPCVDWPKEKVLTPTKVKCFSNLCLATIMMRMRQKLFFDKKKRGGRRHMWLS